MTETYPGAPLSVIQNETLNVIRTLVGDGLCTIGSVVGPPGNRFVPWRMSLDDSLRTIRSAYVDRFNDRMEWAWLCWLELADAGIRAAEGFDAQFGS
ncbi:hypothetical protein LV457_08375 [Mycobacterium sp. MYCO198283]|uniref:hypothetical protein n=1 Tax=Mycobacterium sp. MYCO198283 TaxID=2883505 RepID=UPI001E5FB4F8|nr:hypothetical protein [Mycobacterium sp. MYCO198283]MCG5432308.1 hypothetical protein [Mycobacterium sp. MYCO198283]